MGFYSFNHDTFGKTTHRAGAAGQNAKYNSRHLREAAENVAYNAREEVTYAIRSHVIPPGPKEAEAWFRAQEKKDRKNARMSDRFIGALPRVLTPAQCIEAVEKFCRDISQDRIPWHFALHLELEQKGDAKWNPHTHIIFRDRDIETGRRFLHTSAGAKERPKLAEEGIKAWSTADFRQAWQDHMNAALERAGHDVRIDRRTLKEQGIDRKPQIHVGPGGMKAAAKGRELKSRDIEKGGRTKRYSSFDDGTRAEHNARIVAANAQREAARAPAHEAPTQRVPDERPAAVVSALCQAPAAPESAAGRSAELGTEPQAERQRDAAIGSLERGNTVSCDDLTALNDRDMGDLRLRQITPAIASDLAGPRPSSWRRATVEDYLALCRDPARDLVAWANETMEPKGRRNPHATGEETEQGGLSPPKTPRTVADAIVEDYLELCRDPSRDILAWVNETMWDSPAGWRAQAAAPSLGEPPETAKTVAAGGAASPAWAMLDDSLVLCGNPVRDPGSDFEARKRHEDPEAPLKPRSDDAQSSDHELRANALQAVRVRLEPEYERGRGNPDLSSRSAAGIQKYDGLQSVQAAQWAGVGAASSGWFASEPSGSPGNYGAPGQTPEGRGPEESFDDGEQEQRELGSAFAELSRLVCRQLEEAAKTAPKHELAAIQRFIIQDRERGAAALVREFRESRAHASRKKREQARRPSEPVRPQATAPPELMAAPRAALRQEQEARRPWEPTPCPA